MVNWKKLLISLGSSFGAAAIGSIPTFANIPTWYATLDKPFFTPPNWLFSPVWTILYILIGLSLYWLWTANTQPKLRAYQLYGAQLILNAGWSVVFFGLHWLWPAVVVVLLLWTSIAWSIFEFKPISAASSYAFMPYLAWVTFASALTIGIAFLN